MIYVFLFFFFFNDTATTEIYTLSLHDALPISGVDPDALAFQRPCCQLADARVLAVDEPLRGLHQGDLAAEAGQELAELQPDRAAPEHHRPLGDLAELGRF